MAWSIKSHSFADCTVRKRLIYCLFIVPFQVCFGFLPVNGFPIEISNLPTKCLLII